MARFVCVEDALLRQRVVEFPIGPGDRRTGPLPRVLRVAPADRILLLRAFEQSLHDQARQPTDHRQIRNQGCELWTELPRELVGQRRLVAGGTHPAMTPIFRDVRLDRGQLGHLMASRCTEAVTRPQGVRAMTTAIGDQIHKRIHALGRHQCARVPRMSWLPAWPASAFVPTASHALSPGEAIGRGWLGGRGRVLLAERQLPFEIRDLLLRVRDLFRRLGQLPLTLRSTQSIILTLQALLCIRVALLRLAPRHALHGTPIDSTCTDP
jgi:hypothetical protein